ncbi:MAG: Ig-like domain-containing protein [Pseudomonadota bacterium]
MAITQTFSQITLEGANALNPTSLQFGPDGRLYVSQQNGIINIFDVSVDANGNWQASNQEKIFSINDMPNHNDDGSLNASLGKRQVTGISVEGTASEPTIYVTSSDPRIGGGSSSSDTDLDTNSGVISRLSWNAATSTWDKVDLVIGLPRSEENHSLNGLEIRTESVEVSPGVFEDREIMYVTSGGNTNKGATSNNFAFLPEYYYAAAVLRVDLTQIEQIEADLLAGGGLKGGTAYVDPYIYALPTLDDPTRPNDAEGNDISAGTTGAADAEAGGTFGGNDARNQAKFDDGGPVQIYSPGYRNVYDIVITEAGNIYTFDNGPNNGWGDEPIDINNETVVDASQVATNRPDTFGDPATDPTNNDGAPDGLHLVTEGYYGGHPNPIRASGAASELYAAVTTNDQGTAIDFDTQLTVNGTATLLDDLPSDWNTITGGNTNPIEGVWSAPGSNGSLLTIGSSSNGLAEYTADGIGNGGPNAEYLTVVSFNGNLTIIEMLSDGTNGGTSVSEIEEINVGGTPLDVTTLGNDGIPGSGGVGAGAILVAQYSNNQIAVLVPGGSSAPEDDADGDGILDEADPLQFDPDNGMATLLIGGETLLWDFNPADGTFPGSDDGTGVSGEYSIGMTGWMIDGSSEINPDLAEPLLTDLNNTIRGGAPGVVQIKSVTDGDAAGPGNTQNDALQTGFLPGANVETLTISVPTYNVFSSNANDGVAFTSAGSMGIALGTGDQSNFLRFTIGADGAGTPQFQVLLEEDDATVSTQTIAVPADLLPPNTVDDDFLQFGLLVNMGDPNNITVQAQYEYSQNLSSVTVDPILVGTPITLGANSPIAQALRGEYTVAGQASAPVVSLLATSAGAQEPFTADFLDMIITSTERQVAPVAGDDSARTGIDEELVLSAVDLLANDVDLNEDPLSIVSVQNAVNGTAALSPDGSSVTFNPGAGFGGAASFDYTITDGNGNTDTATVSVDVQDGAVLWRVNAGTSTTVSAIVTNNTNEAGSFSTLPWVGVSGNSFTGDGFTVNTGKSTGHDVTERVDDTLIQTNPLLAPYIVPDYVPQALYTSERWDNPNGAEMLWQFGGVAGADALANGQYTVNLYMSNGFNGTSEPGERIFDIAIEGAIVEDDLDLSATLGHQVGGRFTYTVDVTDGTLDLEFLHAVENPVINGIEIVGSPQSAPQPVIGLLTSSQSVSESGGSIQLTVQSNVPLTQTVPVTFTITPGTAEAGVDYSYSPSAAGSFDPTTGVWTDTLPIAASSSDLTIPVQILSDVDDEAAESFNVTIIDVGSNATIGASTAVVAILDDDDSQTVDGDAVVRINAGGPEVVANDGGIAWSSDQSAVSALGTAVIGAPSAFLRTGGDEHAFGVTSISGANTTGAPDELFTTDRYWDANQNAANWGYDIALDNGDYTVNLYFDELFFGAPGERVFDVEIEDALVLDDFDTFIAAGNSNGTIKQSFGVTLTDGLLNIDFLNPSADNPHVSAIEVIAPSQTTVADALNGTPAPGEDWSNNNLNPDGPFELPLGTSTLSVGTPTGDVDYLTFTVADGQELTGLSLDSYEGDPGNLTFVAISQGTTIIDELTLFQGAQDGDLSDLLDGATIFGASEVGQGLLDELTSTVIENDGTAVAGLPDALPAGDYTLWFSQNGLNTSSTFSLTTQAVQTGTVGAATLSIMEDSDKVKGSSLGSNSFIIENTGDKDIAEVTLDVTGALFQDLVFDPFGAAGESSSKLLKIDTKGSTGVLQPDHGTDQAPGTAYIGIGGTDGYKGIRLLFDGNRKGGFESGESVGFSIDMDSNSLAGADTSILNSGSTPNWDAGGVSGAELIGSSFTVTFTDGTTAIGQIGGAGNQAGAKGEASQAGPTGTVTVDANGFSGGQVGSYGDGGPSITVQGEAGSVARVVVSKGMIQPTENNFTGSFSATLDQQLAALAASVFPANNAVEFQTVDVVLDGSIQDITGQFDFTEVAGLNLPVAEDELPLGIVASIVDPARDNLTVGPVTAPIYLTHQSGSNTAPSVVDDGFNGTEDQSISGNVLSNDSDADEDTLSASALNGPSNGNLSLNTDGSFTYTPDANFNGTDSFTYTASDGNGGFGTGTVALTITAVNDDPDAVDDLFTVGVDEVLSGDVVANDGDVDGDDLSASPLSGPSNGTLALDPDGSFTYAPDIGFEGSDSFTYSVSDGNGGIGNATVSVTVSGSGNTPPVAADDTAQTAENAPLVLPASALLANDSDPDEDPLTITDVNNAVNGIASLAPDGSEVTFTPDPGFTGDASFDYEIADGSGGTDTATVNVTIDASANLAPTAVNDTAQTDIDVPLVLSASALVANDSDPEEDPLEITGVANSVNGMATLAPDGSEVSFTPDVGFAGVASFDYVLSDGNGNTDTATVTVSVGDTDDSVLWRVNAGTSTTLDAIITNDLSEPGSSSTVPWVGVSGKTFTGDGFTVSKGKSSVHDIPNRVDDALILTNPTVAPYRVADYVPQAVFAEERWDNPKSPEMLWQFGGVAGADALDAGIYTVNLFMGNGFNGTSNPDERVFDIVLEGVIVEDDLDLSATLGHNVGGQFSYVVEVTDGTIDLEFLHVLNNPIVNGIEIISGGSVATSALSAPPALEAAAAQIEPQSTIDSAYLDFVAEFVDSGETVLLSGSDGVIDLSSFESDEIRLIAEPKDGVDGIGSVELDLIGLASTVDNSAPFVLPGNLGGTATQGLLIDPGLYQAEIAVYAEDAQGELLEDISFTLEFVDSFEYV